MQIEVEVKGQRIKRLNSPGSVEDTLNYLTCHFVFEGEEWDNTVKTAYFRNPASGKTYSQILAEDNTCTVPWEALTDKGFVRFSVAGERENYRITTNVESFCNSGTIYGGNPSEPPTPDQYDQMIALAEQTKEIAESVRRDADEGKFDGDPGEPGKPGAPGRDGVSPTAKVEQTDDGAVITITDATGTTTAELKNGKEGNPGQNATDEQVRGAVDAYMAEHPIHGDTEDIIKLAIKNEASGAVPVVIADSAEMGVQDIKMQGWTEQDSTTGANLIDYTQAIPRNGNQSVEIIDGGVKWTGDYYFMIPVAGLKKNQNYIMSHEYDNAGNWAFQYSDGTYSSTVYNGHSNTTDPEKDCSAVYIYKTRQTVAGQDMVFTNIMLNEGSTALPYEPYTGGAPSPSPDFPQPIMNAGKYNEGTGKWEYEITIANEQTDPDKNQTVTLTANRPLTKWDRLEKRNGQWGWVYKSAEIALDGSMDENWLRQSDSNGKQQFYITLSDALYPYSDPFKEMFYCDTFLTTNNLGAIPKWQVRKGRYNGLAPVFKPSDDIDTVELFRNFLAENQTTILYVTKEETFIPLSESEQEQMNALHTYYPTTVLSNDAGCEMSIKYIADTKTYIDSKIAAIQAAVANTI